MIQETVVDRALNRLMAHFGSRVVLRPPASAADLRDLEAQAGPLPRDYSLFLMTCNGLRLNLVESGEEHLCSVQEALQACESPQVPSVPQGFVSLRSNADGSADWLVLGEPSINGAVLRWTPGMHGEELLASAFGHYLDNWTRYLTSSFDSHGRRLPEHTCEFDAAYCVGTDPGIVPLRRSNAIRDSFAELELRAAAGEDFE